MRFLEECQAKYRIDELTLLGIRLEDLASHLAEELRIPAYDKTGSPAPKPADLPLSEDQQVLLVAAYELAAFDSDSRKTAAEIVDQAKGHHCDPENVKRALADLVNDKHLLDSKTGRGGGYWLTPEGKRRAKRLKESMG
jgi:hypothetical protein